MTETVPPIWSSSFPNAPDPWKKPGQTVLDRALCYADWVDLIHGAWPVLQDRVPAALLTDEDKLILDRPDLRLAMAMAGPPQLRQNAIPALPWAMGLEPPNLQRMDTARPRRAMLGCSWVAPSQQYIWTYGFHRRDQNGKLMVLDHLPGNPYGKYGGSDGVQDARWGINAAASGAMQNWLARAGTHDWEHMRRYVSRET